MKAPFCAYLTVKDAADFQLMPFMILLPGSTLTVSQKPGQPPLGTL
jgi:hypothetical protein